jgi:GT2 family glycosyltransferase
MRAPGQGAPVVVGISTHNRAVLLRKAIRSALDQSHRPLRIAVVDDGSSDETPMLAREFPTIGWERVDPAQGYVRARNHMMLTAGEEYYVSLDDDAWFLAGDEIAVAVGVLEACPNAAAVAFDILSPDQPIPAKRGSIAIVPMFIGCGHVLRLSAVKELGGYCESPRPYGAEEKDLCLRLIDAGYQTLKIAGVHVWHDKSAIARDLALQHASGVCNDLTLAVRRVPVALLAPVIGYKLLSHLMFAVRRGLLSPCIEGIGAFVAAAVDAWRSRRPVRLASLVRYHTLAKSPGKFAGRDLPSLTEK